MISKTLAHAAKLVVLVAGLALAGCQSANLISLDNEWRETYTAMQNSDFLITATVYPAQLENLSDRAADAGAKAASSDPQTAIGFYRLAAIAAWKAGELGQSKVVTASDAGNALCNNLPMMIASQPRDCSVLLVAPAFALHDREARSLVALSKAVPGRPAQLNPQQLATAREGIEKLRAVFGIVKSARETRLNLLLPTEFYSSFLNSNWKGIYCTTQGFYQFVRRNEPDEMIIGNEIREMESALIAAMIPSEC